MPTINEKFTNYMSVAFPGVAKDSETYKSMELVWNTGVLEAMNSIHASESPEIFYDIYNEVYKYCKDWFESQSKKKESLH